MFILETRQTCKMTSRFFSIQIPSVNLANRGIANGFFPKITSSLNRTIRIHNYYDLYILISCWALVLSALATIKNDARETVRCKQVLGVTELFLLFMIFDTRNQLKRVLVLTELATRGIKGILATIAFPVC